MQLTLVSGIGDKGHDIAQAISEFIVPPSSTIIFDYHRFKNFENISAHKRCNKTNKMLDWAFDNADYQFYLTKLKPSPLSKEINFLLRKYFALRSLFPQPRSDSKEVGDQQEVISQILTKLSEIDLISLSEELAVSWIKAYFLHIKISDMLNCDDFRLTREPFENLRAFLSNCREYLMLGDPDDIHFLPCLTIQNLPGLPDNKKNEDPTRMLSGQGCFDISLIIENTFFTIYKKAIEIQFKLVKEIEVSEAPLSLSRFTPWYHPTKRPVSECVQSLSKLICDAGIDEWGFNVLQTQGELAPMVERLRLEPQLPFDVEIPGMVAIELQDIRRRSISEHSPGFLDRPRSPPSSVGSMSLTMDL